LLFPPIAATSVINQRGQMLADALTAATGYSYEVGIADDEVSLIALMCEAPEETIGFLSAAAYVIAHDLCGVQIGNVSVREDGLSWQAGMIVARRDSGIGALEDLEGKVWAVPDARSIPRNLYFQAMLAVASVQVAESRLVAGDSSAMLAVYNGEADFATAAYIPPILPFEERLWDPEQDSPEIWRRLGISPNRSPIGYVLVNGEPAFGGYRLRDARSRIIDIAPGIYDETLIVSLSALIPNDTVALGAGFPLAAAREIITALPEFVSSESCAPSLCSVDFYGWTGLAVADETSFDPLRFMIEALDLTPDELLKP
jgi:ABC-type phosphate/phosphonate transport system substrate-binding protein